MGAWSTRIFDDDGAADIISEYRILLGYGLSPEKAYKLIQDRFYQEYVGGDEEDVYWLSIALYQWQKGILMEKVKGGAIRCIDDEEYLERWKDSGRKVYEKRKQVLQTLKDKLLHEINPVKKVAKCPAYYRSKTKWNVGDLLAYRMLEKYPHLAESEYENSRKLGECREMLEGKYVLLRVVENKRKPVTELYPELDYMSWSNIMLYDWMGEEIPSEEEIKKIPFKKIVCTRFSNGICRISSAASLNYEKSDKMRAEIIYLGNDSSFAERKPELYLENPRCPGLSIPEFNYHLLYTFASIQDKEVIWEYRS